MPLLVRHFYRGMIARVAAVGEPWKSFFTVEALAAELTALGFAFEDLGQEEINERYFAHRADGLKVGSGGRVVRAHLFHSSETK